MRRTELVRHLKAHGAVFVREGRRHSVFCLGALKTEVPCHNGIVDELARKIGIPFVR